MMAIFASIGMWVVYHSIIIGFNYNLSSPVTMFIKIGFCIQFFHLGVLYKNKLEKMVNSIKGGTLSCCSISIIMMWIITQYIGDTGYSLNWLLFNPNLIKNGAYILCITPLCTSVLGIIFWLQLSKLLVPVLGQNKIINFISNHTFGIMMHHVFCMALFNWFLFLVNKVFIIKELDTQMILTSSWYRYSCGYNGNSMYLMYFIVGFVGSCIISFLTDVFKYKIINYNLKGK